MSKIGLIIIFFTTYVFAQTQTGSTGGCCGGTTTASVTRDKHNKIISIQDEKHQFLNLNEVGKYQKVDDKVSDLLQYASKTLNINFKNVSQLYNFYVFEFISKEKFTFEIGNQVQNIECINCSVEHKHKIKNKQKMKLFKKIKNVVSDKNFVSYLMFVERMNWTDANTMKAYFLSHLDD